MEEEGSGDTQGFSWAEWNAISTDMGWVLSHDRKNDVANCRHSSPLMILTFSLLTSSIIIATGT